MQSCKQKESKRERALKVLELMGTGKTPKEISLALNRPVSTIYKHINAFRTLTGKSSAKAQHHAFDALFYVRSGLSQRKVAKAKHICFDHKYISDLEAMDWAIKVLLQSLDMQAIASMVERGLQAEKRDRTAIREPLGVLSEAFDNVLNHLPDNMSPELEEAITDLTEAIVEVEALVK